MIFFLLKFEQFSFILLYIQTFVQKDGQVRSPLLLLQGVFTYVHAESWESNNIYRQIEG